MCKRHLTSPRREILSGERLTLLNRGVNVLLHEVEKRYVGNNRFPLVFRLAARTRPSGL